MKLVSKSKRRKRAKRRIIIIITLVLIMILGSASGFVALCYYADSLDTVFPNVWAEGVDLSGLTHDEAIQELIDSGYESGAVGIAITIEFPDDSSFTVTGDDVGLALNAAEAAYTAFNFGREGTFFENGITFLKAYFNETELMELSSPKYNDGILKELSEEYTYNFNESLYDNNLNVTSTQITIIKGTGLLPADSQDVFNISVDLMRRAIQQHTHLTQRYIPEPRTDDIIDLQALHEHIHVDPVSSVYDIELLHGTPSSTGKTFDLENALLMLDTAHHGETIVIPIVVLEPDFNEDDIEDMLFRDVLAERTVPNRNSSHNRNTNMAIAARAINGLVMQPGDVFSYNTIVGRRTAARGFQEALGLIGGRFVPSIGGGVCQVSSTIYAALLQTDLEIVNRRPHGLRVVYLPGGQDATVATDVIDFKFRNSSDFPIRVESTVSGNTVNVKIIGTRVSDVYYEIQSNLLSTTPVRLVEREDEDVPPGERVIDMNGQQGEVWETWKLHVTADGTPILDENGNQIRTFVTRDTYRMQDRLILIGPPLAETPTPSPTPTETPAETPTPTPTPTETPPADPDP